MLQLRSTLFPSWSDRPREADPKGSLKYSVDWTSLISVSEGVSLPGDGMMGEVHNRSVCLSKPCPWRESGEPQIGH